MAKRVDPLKAKAAKQKKIAIGGSVLLLALLGIQGPKTLKMLKGPQPVAEAAATTTAPTGTPAPAPTGTEAPAGTPAADPAAAAQPDLAAVADSDPAPVAEQGQLATFERFSSKDPFAQQAEPVVTPPPAAKTDSQTATTGGTTTGGTTPAAAGGGAADGGFTTGNSTPSAPAAAAATSIAVNGTAEDVKPDAAFPAAQPTFLLVKVAKNGKSVEIGIAGGSYAGGDKTITLVLGKKLTLQNTADGSRYELELLAVAGFPPPKK